MSMWFSIATGLALACGGDNPAGPGLSAAGQDDGPVRLNYECGNTFRIRNSSYDAVTVVWEAEGTAERDTVVLPPRPAGEGFSTTLITTAMAAPVLLLDVSGDVIVRKENEGGPACGGGGIGLQPPDSVPSWVVADSNISSGTSFISGEFLKSVLVVRFRNGASLAERQAAMASVNGVVVGGWPMDGAEGRYLVRIEDDGSGAGLLEAAARLNALPQVGVAALDLIVYPQFRRPRDGAGWTEWKLEPAFADGKNWALELLRAPHAWGCATGSAGAEIALVDAGFQSAPELSGSFDPSFAPVLETFDPARQNDHGTSIMALLTASGDNAAGMTGMLWQSQVRVHQVGVPPNVRVALHDVIIQMDQAARAGARVVNVSHAFSWHDQYTGSPSDLARIEQFRLHFQGVLDYFRQDAITSPLFVLAAGNDGLDAGAGGLASVAAGPDSASILVVGAIDVGLRRWQGVTQSSNDGPLVQLAAPGENVFALKGGRSKR